MNRILTLSLLLLALFSAVTAPPSAAVGETTTFRVSEDENGTQGNLGSLLAHVSATGRYVAFVSASTNWDPADTNGRLDIYLKDLATGEIELISKSDSGIVGNSSSVYPTVSADGRFVVYESFASNLVPNDTNDASDVFIRDRQQQTTVRISQEPATGATWDGASEQARISDNGQWVVFSTHFGYDAIDTNGFRDVYLWERFSGELTLLSQYNGSAGNGESTMPDVSADGRFIVFESRSLSFPDNTNGPLPDVYLVDRQSGILERVSMTTGSGGNEWVVAPRVSDNGRYVTFSGPASLVAGDTNGDNDVFVFDRDTQTTIRISLGPNGEQSSWQAINPDISGDGQTVAYDSRSDVFVPGDTNSKNDIFLYDLQSGMTTIASLSTTGAQGNDDSEIPSLPTDGDSVVYHSDASNLVPGDSNFENDVFMRGEPPVIITPTPSTTPLPTFTPTAPAPTPSPSATATIPVATTTSTPLTATPTSAAATATSVPPTASPTIGITQTPSPTSTVSSTPQATVTTTPPTPAPRLLYLPLIQRERSQ